MRYLVFALVLALVAAGCGGSSESSSSAGLSPAVPVTTPVVARGVTLRVNFAGSPRLLLATESGLGATSTFTVQVLQAPNGPLVTQLDHIARTPPNASSQDVLLGALPNGSLLLRVLFFDANGTNLGFSEQTFSFSGGDLLLTVSSLTPNPGPSPTPASTPTPSPAATPSPSPFPSPIPSPASPSPSPTSSPSPTASVSPSPVASLTLQPAQASLAILGTQAFNASQGSQDVSSSVAWTSSNPRVAVVSPTGVATAVGGGSATINASLAGQQGQAGVSVSGPTLNSLTISPTSFTVTVPFTAQFSALGQYSDGTTRDLSALVSWSSSASPVVSVSSTGLATAVTGGAATITASLGTLSAQAQGTSAPQVVAPFQPIPVPPAPAKPRTPNGHTFPLFIVQQNGRVVKVDSNGAILANPFAPIPGDAGNFKEAVVDAAGNLFEPNGNLNSLTRITPGGTPNNSFVTAGLGTPQAVKLDRNGILYVTNFGPSTITRIDPSGPTVTPNFITTNLVKPIGLAIDATGNFYVTNQSTITAYTATGAVLTSFGTNGILGGFAGLLPAALAIDSTGAAYVTNFNANSIFKVNLATGTITPLVTTGLSGPCDITVDNDDNLYVADFTSARIFKIAAGTNTLTPFVTGLNTPTGLALSQP